MTNSNDKRVEIDKCDVGNLSSNGPLLSLELVFLSVLNRRLNSKQLHQVALVKALPLWTLSRVEY